MGLFLRTTDFQTMDKAFCSPSVGFSKEGGDVISKELVCKLFYGLGPSVHLVWDLNKEPFLPNVFHDHFVPTNSATHILLINLFFTGSQHLKNIGKNIERNIKMLPSP